jgi:hypothetical protein
MLMANDGAQILDGAEREVIARIAASNADVRRTYAPFLTSDRDRDKNFIQRNQSSERKRRVGDRKPSKRTPIRHFTHSSLSLEVVVFEF